MKSTLSTFLFSVAVLLCPGAVFAQSDYKSLEKKGDQQVVKGNYNEAVTQYNGALASMSINRIDKNSTEYMTVEQKLNGARNCLGWSRIVDSGLENLSEAKILSLFENAEDADEMERIKDDLLKKVKTVQANVNNILQRFPSDLETAKKRALCEQRSMFIQSAMENQEELLAWIGYRNQHTQEACEAFLSEYPDGKYAPVARDSILALREVRAWASLASSPSESAMEAYIRDFPNGKHLQEVRGQLEQYQLRRKDETAWDEAVRKGTSTAFAQYSSNFPRGAHRSEADQKYKEALMTEDDAAWNRAETTGSIDAYKKYLATYPNGRHAADAKKGQDRINDHKLWDKYRQTDTKEAYQAYLSESKMKIHETEARNRIRDIDTAAKMAIEEDLWATALRAGSEEAFRNYLSATELKSHEEEAKAMIALKHAQGLKASGAAPDDLVKAYAEADKLGVLGPQDKANYQEAKDEVAYLRFTKNHEMSQGKKYLTDFPEGRHAAEVADYLATTLADQLNWQSSESEYQTALRYAVSQKTKNYVTNKYEKAKKEYRRILRKNDKEPFHALLGIGAESVFLDFTTFAQSLSDRAVPNLGVTAALSFGGHSNRFNFELGGGYYNFSDAAYLRPAVPEYSIRITASPRLNIIKKRNLGDHYSAGYLYIAPTASFDIYDNDPSYSNIALGGKVGFGLSIFDFYIGYHSVIQSFVPNYSGDGSYFYYVDEGRYLSLGMMIYLSGK